MWCIPIPDFVWNESAKHAWVLYVTFKKMKCKLSPRCGNSITAIWQKSSSVQNSDYCQWLDWYVCLWYPMGSELRCVPQISNNIINLHDESLRSYKQHTWIDPKRQRQIDLSPCFAASLSLGRGDSQMKNVRIWKKMINNSKFLKKVLRFDWNWVVLGP